MKLVTDTISVAELEKMSEKMHGNLVKVVVDVEREIMVVDAEMHSDEELFLLEGGSDQKNLWGINFHPNAYGSEEWIEFDSMINLRPGFGNRSRGVDDPNEQAKIRQIVAKRVKP